MRMCVATCTNYVMHASHCNHSRLYFRTTQTPRWEELAQNTSKKNRLQMPQRHQAYGVAKTAESLQELPLVLDVLSCIWHGFLSAPPTIEISI